MKKLIFTIWILVLAVIININRVEGQWTSIGPNGATIIASASYENKLFIATEDNAVFRSLDNGMNWEFVYTVPNLPYRITSIEVTSTDVFIPIFWDAVRSTNNGDTWNSLRAYFCGPTNVIKSINGILYLGDECAYLHKSTNNGVNWTETGNFDLLFSHASISDIISNGLNIFVSDFNGLIYKGNNNGTNWSICLNLDSVDNLSITKLESNDTLLFASTAGNGILRSSDNGNTWNYANNGLTNLSVNSLKCLNSKIFATTNDGVFVSFDNGSSWVLVNNGLPQFNANNLFKGDAAMFVGCSSKGIYKTTDFGNNWSESNNGFTGKTITSIASNSQYLFAGTSRGELYRSSNQGVNWTSIYDLLQYREVSKLLVKDNFIFCGTQGSGNNNMFRSSNNGDSWELKADGLLYSIYDIAVSNAGIFAAAGSGVYYSSNNGNNWVAKNNGLPVNNEIRSVFSDGNYIYIGVANFIYRSTNNGDNWILKSNGFQGQSTSFAKIANFIFASSFYFYNPSGCIFRSSDNGENWISHNNGFIGSSAYSLQTSGDYILAASDSGFFYTYDYGLSWYQDNQGFNKNKIILEIYSEQDRIFAGLSSGAIWTNNISVLPVEVTSFSSTVYENNITLNWQTSREINNSGFDIERSAVKDQWSKVGFVQGNGNTNNAIDYAYEDKIYTPGKYKYRLKQIDFNGSFEYFNLSGEVVIGVPEKYELSQNYPNPFNPSTVIRYSLTENSLTSLKIYDALGREMAKLVNEEQEAGRYEVIFNGSNFASGVYLYELRSGSFVSQKRMLLLK